ncbi:RNA-directed DNA polymerase from mobile element jockey [Eumeta japonica]|uniref:RNA-directed DNA polymerase from mobile element jockey n=1 Tax=Eumeta variegata TaxID=151549 RepID=A0A4C1SM65_EUMVA|nr:RNA-directed DNA polymerase from mobile element jockey [Eumeta japonica]
MVQVELIGWATEPKGKVPKKQAKLKERRCTVAVSLDIEKAFDKAYHDGILVKMVNIGFDPSLIKLFRSFFNDRKFCVQLGNEVSRFGSVLCGVPQGSVLAPHLYNIFIHDFPHDFGLSQGILYADDSLLYAHDESPKVALQRVSLHLNKVDEFYSNWGIKINVAKSFAICLRNASENVNIQWYPRARILS